jgi:hypothetical protein
MDLLYVCVVIAFFAASGWLVGFLGRLGGQR